MITAKTNIQEKFNRLPGVHRDCILKFNEYGELQAVDPSYQGILPQIKVVTSTGHSVVCKKVESNNSEIIINKTTEYPTNTYYFNVPGLGTYKIYDTSSDVNGGNAVQTTIVVADYKQYSTITG